MKRNKNRIPRELHKQKGRLKRTRKRRMDGWERERDEKTWKNFFLAATATTDKWWPYGEDWTDFFLVFVFRCPREFSALEQVRSTHAVDLKMHILHNFYSHLLFSFRRSSKMLSEGLTRCVCMCSGSGEHENRSIRKVQNCKSRHESES